MYFLLSACQSPLVLKIIYFINLLLQVVFIIVPVILIVMVVIDLVQLVTNPEQKIGSKDKDAKVDVRRLLPKRILIAVLLFFVPLIVKFTMNVIAKVVDPDANTFLSCLNPDKSDIEEAESNYQELLEQEQAELEEYYKQKSEEVKNKSKDPEKKSVTGNSTDDDSDVDESKVILVGDSRTVKIGQDVDTDAIIIAESGAGIDWFKSSAVSQVNSILEDGSKYNIVIFLGINDLDNLTRYEANYALLPTYWSKHNVIIVSVTPIDASKYTGYANNSTIHEFNVQLKEYINGVGDNLSYCDIWFKISADYTTESDGLHYDTTTTKKIYEEIMECVE